jgi:putative hydrolase of the HAD superfamily
VSGNNGKIGVTFDLWETLIFDRPEKDEERGRMRCRGIRDTLETLGISLNIDDVKRGYDQSASQMQNVWDQNMEVPTFEQIRLILELAGLPIARIPTDTTAVQRLVEAYVEPIVTLPPPLGEDVVDTLEDVRALGAKIGLVSNTGRAPGDALRQMLQEYGVLKYFDATVFSNEIGFRKPDSRIFIQTLTELGVSASRVVHVGDNPEADFNGARQAGMRALLYDPELQSVAKWRSDSLFALSRRHKHQSAEAIDSDLRINTLRNVSSLVRKLMALD